MITERLYHAYPFSREENDNSFDRSYLAQGIMGNHPIFSQVIRMKILQFALLLQTVASLHIDMLHFSRVRLGKFHLDKFGSYFFKLSISS